MDTRASTLATTLHAYPRAGYRAVWHAVAVLAAAAIAWLVFSAYRQPDFILNLADLRLC